MNYTIFDQFGWLVFPAIIAIAVIGAYKLCEIWYDNKYEREDQDEK